MSAERSGAYLSGLGKFLWRSAGQYGSQHLRGKCRCGRGADCCGMVVGVGQCEACSDAGVEETGLSFVVVVAELGRTAVTPWVAFHVSGLRLSGLWT